MGQVQAVPQLSLLGEAACMIPAALGKGHTLDGPRSVQRDVVVVRRGPTIRPAASEFSCPGARRTLSDDDGLPERAFAAPSAQNLAMRRWADVLPGAEERLRQFTGALDSYAPGLKRRASLVFGEDDKRGRRMRMSGVPPGRRVSFRPGPPRSRIGRGRAITPPEGSTYTLSSEMQ